MAKQTSQFPQKHKGLPLETIKTGINYAFTINPIDKYQLFNSFTRLNDIMKETHHYIGTLKNYVFYPEISPKGRFHLHGWTWFNDYRSIVEFYMDYLPQLQKRAAYEFDELNDPDRWSTYCTKQKAFHDVFTLLTYHSVPLKREFQT